MSRQKANISVLMVAHGVGAEIALNASGAAADRITLLPIGAGFAEPWHPGSVGSTGRSMPEATGVVAYSAPLAQWRTKVKH